MYKRQHPKNSPLRREGAKGNSIHTYIYAKVMLIVQCACSVQSIFKTWHVGIFDDTEKECVENTRMYYLCISSRNWIERSGCDLVNWWGDFNEQLPTYIYRQVNTYFCTMYIGSRANSNLKVFAMTRNI